mgnify:FL=1
MRSMWTAATGMKAQQFNIDTISHNLSNVNTTAYKRNRAEFQDLFYANIRRMNQLDERKRPVNLEVGHGTQPVATKRDFSTYSFIDSGSPTDLALQGEGFFCISDRRGEEVYTRDGSFKLSMLDDGTANLVTSDGNYVLSANGDRINFDPSVGDLVFSLDGRISQKITGTDQMDEITSLKLVRFPNPQALEARGRNLYARTINSGGPVALTEANSTTSVLQNYLEMSNVQIVDEMVKMITAQRAYEINSKAITTSDEMLQTANGLKR